MAKFPGRTLASAGCFVICLLGAAGCQDKPPLPPEDDTLIRLTDDARVEEGLSWSPDGERLVFAAREGGSARLFVLEVTTGAVMEFWSETGNCTEPVWSPDGVSIAATLTVSGESSLRIVNYPGATAASSLVSCPAIDDGCEFSPTWAPLGGRLAVLVNDAPTCMRMFGTIYTFTLGNYGCTSVSTSGYGDGNGSLDWANHSDYIAYSYNVMATDTWRIRVAPIGSGSSYDLVPGAWRDHSPDWSPDDALICFTSDRGGSRDIWMAVADNSEPALRVTDDDVVELYPRWSPDGRRIAYIANRDGQVDIWSVKVPLPSDR